MLTSKDRDLRRAAFGRNQKCATGSASASFRDQKTVIAIFRRTALTEPNSVRQIYCGGVARAFLCATGSASASFSLSENGHRHFPADGTGGVGIASGTRKTCSELEKNWGPTRLWKFGILAVGQTPYWQCGTNGEFPVSPSSQAKDGSPKLLDRAFPLVVAGMVSTNTLAGALIGSFLPSFGLGGGALLGAAFGAFQAALLAYVITKCAPSLLTPSNERTFSLERYRRMQRRRESIAGFGMFFWFPGGMLFLIVYYGFVVKRSPPDTWFFVAWLLPVFVIMLIASYYDVSLKNVRCPGCRKRLSWGDACRHCGFTITHEE